jgi:glycosyltransferase involved in cell wall biosynthesis
VDVTFYPHRHWWQSPNAHRVAEFPTHIPKRIAISVAIASYNGARFILEQLESIEAQALRPFEIVVSDDASDDETLAVVQRFAASSSIPLRVHRQPARLGAFRNFEAALAMCSGSHIAYCNQDDVWETDKLSRMASLLDQDGVVLALHQSFICDSKLKPIGRGVVLPNLAEGCYSWPGPSGPVWGHAHQMVFRRELWQLTQALLACPVQPKPELMSDFDSLLLCSAGILGNVYFVSTALTHSRRHPQALTGAGNFRPGGRVIRRLALQRRSTQWHYKNATEWRRFLDAPCCRAVIDAYHVPVPGRSQNSSSYLKTLDQRIAANKARLDVYTAASTLQRILAVFRMISKGALGDVYTGRWHRKLLLLDALAAVVQPRFVERALRQWSAITGSG